MKLFIDFGVREENYEAYMHKHDCSLFYCYDDDDGKKSKFSINRFWRERKRRRTTSVACFSFVSNIDSW